MSCGSRFDACFFFRSQNSNDVLNAKMESVKTGPGAGNLGWSLLPSLLNLLSRGHDAVQFTG